MSKQKGLAALFDTASARPNTKLLIMQGLVPRCGCQTSDFKGIAAKNVLSKDLRISGWIQMV
jgi:hypothetical protein